MALPSGTIVVADSGPFGGSGALVAVDPASGRQTTLSEGGMFVDPGGVALAPGNRAFVSDGFAFGQGGLFEVDLATGRQRKIAASTEFHQPLGIICNPQGQLVVAYADAVVLVEPENGNHHSLTPNIDFNQATGVALEANGNLIVTDFDLAQDGRIHRITPGGADAIFARGIPATGADYASVVIAPGGSILVTNAPSITGTRQNVLRFDPVTGAVTVVSEGQMLSPRPVGLALEPSSGAIVVACAIGIVRVHPVTGAQTLISSGGSLVSPLGVAVVP